MTTHTSFHHLISIQNKINTGKMLNIFDNDKMCNIHSFSNILENAYFLKLNWMKDRNQIADLIKYPYKQTHNNSLNQSFK